MTSIKVADFWKIFSVFLTSFFGFGKVSMPSAIALFNFDFWKTMGITCSGGITGAIVFTNISAALMKWWHNAKIKWFRNHRHPKVFTKSNRRIIRIKKRFGIWGIAIVTQLGVSMPVGTFLAERFYKDKKKVILTFSIVVIVWYALIYFLMLFFYDTISRFL